MSPEYVPLVYLTAAFAAIGIAGFVAQHHARKGLRK